MVSLPAEEVRAVLARSPLFSALPAADVDRVVALARRRRLDEGEILFHRGEETDSVYAILRGRVRVVSPGEDGREVVLRILQPGEILGEISVFYGGRRTASIVAAEPCELLVIGRRAFLELIEQHPRLATGLLAALAERVAELTEQLSDFALNSLPVRLARRILELAEIYGKATPGGLRIDAGISQQDLASWVGTTREAVNKHLRAWATRGVIRLDRAAVTILRREELERLAGGPPPA